MCSKLKNRKLIQLVCNLQCTHRVFWSSNSFASKYMYLTCLIGNNIGLNFWKKSIVLFWLVCMYVQDINLPVKFQYTGMDGSHSHQHQEGVVRNSSACYNWKQLNFVLCLFQFVLNNGFYNIDVAQLYMYMTTSCMRLLNKLLARQLKLGVQEACFPIQL